MTVPNYKEGYYLAYVEKLEWGRSERGRTQVVVGWKITHEAQRGPDGKEFWAELDDPFERRSWWSFSDKAKPFLLAKLKYIGAKLPLAMGDPLAQHVIYYGPDDRGTVRWDVPSDVTKDAGGGRFETVPADPADVLRIEAELREELQLTTPPAGAPPAVTAPAPVNVPLPAPPAPPTGFESLPPPPPPADGELPF